MMVDVDDDGGGCRMVDDDDVDDDLLYVQCWQIHLENQLVFLHGFVRNINCQKIPCVQIHPS